MKKWLHLVGRSPRKLHTKLILKKHLNCRCSQLGVEMGKKRRMQFWNDDAIRMEVQMSDPEAERNTSWLKCRMQGVTATGKV